MRVKVAAVLLPLAIILGSCSIPSPANLAEAPQTTEAQKGKSYNIALYAEVLSTYVNDDGWVDYDGLQANRSVLDEFNASLNTISLETYNGWSDSEKIAFLINAYNALTLQSIVDQTPLKSSIRDIPGVWRIRKHPILEDAKTLDTIEHEILRKDFQEPRIHSALVCAARSCPPLRNEPYSGDGLDDQLDDQVATWLALDTGVVIDRDKNTVSISAIFDWFGDDWIGAYGTEAGFTGSATQKATLNFISNYLNEADAAYLRDGNYTLTYLDYDWSLNQQ